jgi:hypothetical protein
LIACGSALRELSSELKKDKITSTVASSLFPQSLFHSVDHNPASLAALESFIDGAKISVRKPCSENSRYHVSRDYPDLCGALTGLSFVSTEKVVDCGIELELARGTLGTVISSDNGQILNHVRQGSRELFVVSVSELLDLRESTAKTIDFRTCFSQVVPVLIALRHLFRNACWTPETHYANIVIDDPPLWQTYGHLHLRELAALTDRTGCACTIAMIPLGTTNALIEMQSASWLVASRG